VTAPSVASIGDLARMLAALGRERRQASRSAVTAPSVASIGDLARMLAALGREHDIPSLQQVRRLR